MRKRLMPWCAAGLAVVFAAPGRAAPFQPSALFDQIGLTSKQRAAIDEGRPVAKVLSWGESSEVYVFGAVFIEGSPATYLKAARNVERLAGSQGYLGGGELPSNPTRADLSALTIDPDDVKALKKCKEADCNVQLPTASMQTFQQSVNWSRPDADAQVNELARGMVLSLIQAYRRGGNPALGEYRDKDHPTRIAAQFERMVGQSAALPNVLPELRQYLLRYPNADLPGADSFFYWEKVDFGLKPTIRVNHGVIYQPTAGNGDVSAVTIKQLYASHYFYTALDVSVCVRDTARPERHGFYLVTLKSSAQDGLTGVKGSMVRKMVVDKTRSSLETALASIKRKVEQAGSATEGPAANYR